MVTALKIVKKSVVSIFATILISLNGIINDTQLLQRNLVPKLCLSHVCLKIQHSKL